LTERSSFTLVEFLGVLAIVLVLSAIIVPAVLKATGSARRGRAKLEMQTIAQGLKAYRAACGFWPGQTKEESDDYYPGSRHRDLIGPLTNAPGGRKFVELTESAVREGEWLDPWGRPYEIAIDQDNDGMVNLPESPPFTNIADTVAVLSKGPDPGRRDKWVMSWTK
jgi:type II secretory pathway pseudopilin PulG